MSKVRISKEELEALLRDNSKEEFHQWRAHPVTSLLFNFLDSRREELKEMWASGNFSAPSLDEMAIRNAAAQGASSILSDILNLDSDSFRTYND